MNISYNIRIVVMEVTESAEALCRESSRPSKQHVTYVIFLCQLPQVFVDHQTSRSITRFVEGCASQRNATTTCPDRLSFSIPMKGFPLGA